MVLPDHLHAVWRLPEGDADFPLRWRKLKARFSRSVGGTYRRSDSKIAKGERGLWQRRYWEHMIRDADDWRRHVEYCWINPVKHGLVGPVRDWPHSSYLDVRRGAVGCRLGRGMPRRGERELSGSVGETPTLLLLWQRLWDHRIRVLAASRCGMGSCRRVGRTR